MALFNTFNESYSDYDVDLTTKYAKSDSGAFYIMEECLKFDEEITLEMLRVDYKEMAAVREGYSEDEIEAMQEGTVQDIWTKIKNFFVKIGKKIKEFVLGWIARIRAKLTSDNKAFYNRYKDQVKNKESIEIKYRKPNLGWQSEGDKIDQVLVKLIIAFKITQKERSSNSDEEYNKNEELDVNEDDLDTVKEECLKLIADNKGDVSLDNTKKDIEEFAYSDDSPDTYRFGAIKGDIEKMLQDTKCLDKLKKFADKAEKNAKNNKLLDLIKKEGHKKNSTVASRASRIASLYGSLVSKYVTAATSITKEQYSQARTAYAKAVQAKPKI